MPLAMQCPFFGTDYRNKNGSYQIKCEMAKLEFVSGKELSEYACKFCASSEGWKRCTLAQCTNKRYV